MRPAVTQVLASPANGNMSGFTIGEQEKVKRKASESIGDSVPREDNTSRAEHLNGNGWSFENGADGQRTKSRSSAASKGQMITGCVPCLIVGIPCNPSNPGCRMAMSTEWSVNENDGDESALGLSRISDGLDTLRIDTKWRRNWRERHSLNFFVTFVSIKSGIQDGVRTMLLILAINRALRRWLASLRTLSGLNVSNTHITSLSYSMLSLQLVHYTSQYSEARSRTRRQRLRLSNLH